MEGKRLYLDLGSGNTQEGEHHPDGYILQDIEPHQGIDLVCDIKDLDKHIKPEQCRRIRISHTLEHFPTAKVVPLLKMLHKLLETNGELLIDVPNFKWHASLLLQDRDAEAVNYAYGGQRDQYDFHKTAFTPQLLLETLKEAGFTIKQLDIEQSLHAIAIKT